MNEARTAILSTLLTRSEGATICPSEAARSLADDEGEWRERMPDIHAAVDRLLEERAITISWKGQALPKRDGPYRIARAAT